MKPHFPPFDKHTSYSRFTLSLYLKQSAPFRPVSGDTKGFSFPMTQPFCRSMLWFSSYPPNPFRSPPTDAWTYFCACDCGTLPFLHPVQRAFLSFNRGHNLKPPGSSVLKYIL